MALTQLPGTMFSTVNTLSSAASTNLVLQTNAGATTAITVDTNGNIGFGPAPSAWTGATGLQVQYATVEGRSSLPSFAEYAANSYSQAGTRKYIATDYASRYTQYQGVHYWQVAPSGTAGTNITFNQALILDNAGNLLLGVSLPIGSLGNSKLYASTGISAINNGGTLPYFQTYVSTAATNLKTWRHGGDSSGNYNFQTVNDAYSGSSTYLSITSTGQIFCPNYIGITGTATTIATGVSFLALLRDRGNGGTALVLYDLNSSPAIVIVSQTGGTTFTLSAPSATQIQLGNLGGGGGLTALGGSSRNPDNINVLILQGQ